MVQENVMEKRNSLPKKPSNEAVSKFLVQAVGPNIRDVFTVHIQLKIIESINLRRNSLLHTSDCLFL